MTVRARRRAEIGWAAIVAGAALVAVPRGAVAGLLPPVREEPDLASLSLEQLMAMEVTSVSKRPETLSTAAAAIYVITREDIRRSGMTSLPDLLRQVPGLDVAQSDASHWAVSARGFNSVYSSKLLVLLDGRSIYSPFFSGVIWDVQDPPLEDIERIEVIRGPGGTLWGANAVNGVINITTRRSQNTIGGLVSAVAGHNSRDQIVLRQGGQISDTASYRVWLSAYQDGPSRTRTGGDAGDEAAQAHAGFRVDWTPSVSDTVSLDGELYRQKTRALLTMPSLMAPPAPRSYAEYDKGGHLMAAWQRQLSPTSDLRVQVFFNRDITEENTSRGRLDTYDVEVKHHFLVGARHDVVWGGGYRRVEFAVQDNPFFTLVRRSGETEVYNLFVQDEMKLSETLRAIGGVKVEHNSFTGLEYEPTLRLVWAPSPDRTVWAAASRVVRMPSIVENYLRLEASQIPGATPVVISIQGDPDLTSETEVALELGYRQAVSANFTIDATIFHNRYEDLVGVTPGVPRFEPGPVPHIVQPAWLRNVMRGHSYGGEVVARWQATPSWRLTGSYDLLVAETEASAPLLSFSSNETRNSPRNQIRLSSRLDLPHGVEFDVSAQYSGKASPIGLAAQTGPYTRLDARLGWRPVDRLEVGVVGQNLLDDRHAEQGPIYFREPSEVSRAFSVYLRAEF